jgi:hypothetical protein
LSENRILGKEILQAIETDPNISTENKLLIKSQLLTIINGGQESVPSGELAQLETPVVGSGVMGFMGGVVKIFFIIIGIILGLFLIGFIVYRLTRKSSDMGFQDFLIDSVAHTRSKTPPPTNPLPVKKTPEDTTDILAKVEHTTSNHDPLASIGNYTPPPPPQTPSEGLQSIIATTLSPADTHSTEASETDTKISEENHSIPDWLKPLEKNQSSSSDLISTPV